jgi:hypothetical protein
MTQRQDCVATGWLVVRQQDDRSAITTHLYGPNGQLSDATPADSM